MSQIHVKYQNAIYANYSVVAQAHVPALRLLRSETDLSLLDSKALITVNGYVHNTMYDGINLWILDGDKSMVKAKSNHVGIHSFFDFPGSLTKTPLKLDMLDYAATSTYYDGGIIIDLPNPVQTIILVIGGYMQREEVNVLERVSDTQFILYLDNTDYLKRLTELSKYRDIFTELNIPLDPSAPAGFSVYNATTDDVVKRFMTMTNSFVVSVPVNSVTSEIAVLDKMVEPGKFTTQVENRWPLFSGYGKCLEYYKKLDEGKWTNVIVDPYYINGLYPPLTNDELTNYNILRTVDKLMYMRNGYFLKLSSEV